MQHQLTVHHHHHLHPHHHHRFLLPISILARVFATASTGPSAVLSSLCLPPKLRPRPSAGSPALLAARRWPLACRALAGRRTPPDRQLPLACRLVDQWHGPDAKAPRTYTYTVMIGVETSCPCHAQARVSVLCSSSDGSRASTLWQVSRLRLIQRRMELVQMPSVRKVMMLQPRRRSQQSLDTNE